MDDTIALVDERGEGRFLRFGHRSREAEPDTKPGPNRTRSQGRSPAISAPASSSYSSAFISSSKTAFITRPRERLASTAPRFSCMACAVASSPPSKTSDA